MNYKQTTIGTENYRKPKQNKELPETENCKALQETNYWRMKENHKKPIKTENKKIYSKPISKELQRITGNRELQNITGNQ